MTYRGILLVSAASWLLATSAQAAEGTVSGVQLEEVVITAEKRETRLQDTPISITALSGEALTARGVQTVEALTTFTPNVTFQEFQGNALLTIRGVSSDNISSGGDPATAFHVDGIYAARSIAAESVLYDVERVEVLRGPQGTLYGRNATGGSVNVITRPPQMNVSSLEGDATIGDYNATRLRGAVNAPLGENAALRLTGVWDRHDGYLKVLGRGQGEALDDNDFQSLRGQLKTLVGDDVDVTVRLSYARREGQGPGEKIIGLLRPVLVGPFAFPIDSATGFGGSPNPSDVREVRLNRPNKFGTSVADGSLTVNWRTPIEMLGRPTFRFIAGYERLGYHLAQDTDNTDADILFSDLDKYNHQESYEAQLISSNDDRLQWIVGAYYFRESGEDRVAVDYNAFPSAFAVPTIPVRLGMNIVSTSLAAFGQATWRASDHLRLTAGLRQTHDEKDAVNRASQGGPTAIIAEKASWDATTGKVGVDWIFDDDHMVYGSASRGYKGGGFALGQGAFDPEHIWAYELGSKNSFADRRVILNLAAFYYDYTNLQVSYLATGAGGAPTLKTENAASSRIFGAEAESVWAVTPSLRISAQLSLLDAKFRSYRTLDPSRPDLGVQSLNGRSMINAPKWTATLTAEYEHALAGGGEITPRLTLFHSDRVLLRPFAVRPYDEQDAYTRVDASLTWSSPSRRYEAEVFVRNVGDLNVASRAQYIQVTNNFRAAYAPPRIFGLRLGVNY